MVTRDRAVDVAGRSEAERRVSAIAEIVAALVSRGDEEGYGLNLNALKNATARKYKLSKAPKLTELIAAVPVEHRDQLMPKLRAKPVRTASGVAVVAVMSKPHRCPHIATTGNVCVYCPGGPDSDFEYSTQSYTCLLYTSPSPRDKRQSRMPSSA